MNSLIVVTNGGLDDIFSPLVGDPGLEPRRPFGRRIYSNQKKILRNGVFHKTRSIEKAFASGAFTNSASLPIFI